MAGRMAAMLDTSARLLRLLSLLQARRDWTGPALAERLGVTTRTVRNDVERLRNLGYPVHATPGAAGGYRLGAGAQLPPLLLDDEEAVAVAVGLRTAAGGTVTGIEETSVRALTKLEQVLPARLRHRVNALHTATVADARRRPDRRRGRAHHARRGLPRPRAAAVRLHHPRRRRGHPHRRAAPPRPRPRPLVPRRLRPRPARLAHVPRGPPPAEDPHRPAVHPARAARRRPRRRTSRRSSAPRPGASAPPSGCSPRRRARRDSCRPASSCCRPPRTSAWSPSAPTPRRCWPSTSDCWTPTSR